MMTLSLNIIFCSFYYKISLNCRKKVLVDKKNVEDDDDSCCVTCDPLL